MESKRYSILIVDDQGESIALLMKILYMDYSLMAAKSGFDAIETAEKYIPDIILLDIIMPEMDGYEVIAELKSRDITKDIPIIFLTGLDDPEEEEKGLALGAADYITKPFSPAIVKLRLNNQVKMLEQIRLIKHLSMIDQLTQLPNRKNFEERLKIEWGKSEREQTPISVLVVDVDQLKAYNEIHGHKQGDKALRNLAETLKITLSRPDDFVARWGGEEFIVLLPNTDAKVALDIADQLRNNASDLVIPDAKGIPTRITVSIGVNSKKRWHKITLDEFISEADFKLKGSKNTGRNKIYYQI